MELCENADDAALAKRAAALPITGSNGPAAHACKRLWHVSITLIRAYESCTRACAPSIRACETPARAWESSIRAYETSARACETPIRACETLTRACEGPKRACERSARACESSKRANGSSKRAWESRPPTGARMPGTALPRVIRNLQTPGAAVDPRSPHPLPEPSGTMFPWPPPPSPHAPPPAADRSPARACCSRSASRSGPWSTSAWRGGACELSAR